MPQHRSNYQIMNWLKLQARQRESRLVFLTALHLAGIGVLVHGIKSSWFHPDLIFPTAAIIFIAFLGIEIVSGASGREITRHSGTLAQLEDKQKFLYRMLDLQNWDELTRAIFDYLCTIAPIRGATLSLYHPITSRLDLINLWIKDFKDQEAPDNACMTCPHVIAPAALSIHSCTYQAQENQTVYCVPLPYGNSMLGFIRFSTQGGQSLEPDQLARIDNLVPDIAHILRHNQLRKIQTEVELQKAAQEERKAYVRDLHDTLAQDLAFLKMISSQYADSSIPIDPGQLFADMNNIKAAASEGYDYVRGTMSALHPENVRRLSSLFQNHVQAVADRSGLLVEYRNQGSPGHMEAMIVHEVFSIFREALTNIERFSQATRIVVDTEWKDNELSIVIEDNGRGINPTHIAPERQYGLRLMFDRIRELDGVVSIKIGDEELNRLAISIPLDRQKTGFTAVQVEEKKSLELEL